MNKRRMAGPKRGDRQHRRGTMSTTRTSTQRRRTHDCAVVVTTTPSQSRSSSSSTSSSFLGHLPLVACVIASTMLSTGVIVVDAGISFGGVTTTDACYAALQNAEMADGSERVDKNGYVDFINELGDGALTAFRFDEETQGWGFFPVTEFEDLPSSIKGVFYDVACGGAFVACGEAYLYTSGTRDDTNPQDVVYLFELCSGAQDAIDAELEQLELDDDDDDGEEEEGSEEKKPTPAPSTGGRFPSGDEIFALTYRAAVSNEISSGGLNDPNGAHRNDLLGAMSAWTAMTADELNGGGGREGRRRYGGSSLRGRRRESGGRRRGLLVYPKPSVEADGISLMDVVDVECSEDIAVELQLDSDHCIEVTTNVTIEFVGEPVGSDRTDTIVYFEDQFEVDVENGVFHDLIVPASTKLQFRAIYSATPAGNVTMTIESATEDSYPDFNVDDFLEEAEKEEGGGEGGEEGGGGSNVAGIAAGVCIGVAFVGIIGLFVYRRRRRAAEDKSDGGDGTSGRDGRESYNTPDFDMEGVNDLKGRADDGGGSEASSRDQISSAESDSDSSSMASFSGSSSSDYTSTSSTGSSADDVSRGSSNYRSSASGAGTTSVGDVDDVRPSSKGPRDDPNSPRDSRAKRNVARAAAAFERESELNHSGSVDSARDVGRRSATPTDDDSSAGSSGWDSSDGESSVDSRSAESSMNFLNQSGVTMHPVNDGFHDSNDSSTSSSAPSVEKKLMADSTPESSDIEDAIEMGDWEAVGATAAILASSDLSAGARREEDDDGSDSNAESYFEDDASNSDSSDRISYGAKSAETPERYRGESESLGTQTVDSDVARNAEIDRLVESGNWDGVVAVAARYVEEADEAEEQLRRPLRRPDRNSPPSKVVESDVESASVETADESAAYSNSSHSSASSHDSNNLDVIAGESIATRSRSRASSGSGVKTISTSSSLERRRINAYRAEVEALVRRVVPDELPNVDDILIQFNGREQELIETLRAMQEKSIAQRARAAVQRSAKREARSTGRSDNDSMDDESIEGISNSEHGRSAATDPSDRSSTARDSITDQFTNDNDDYSSTSRSSEGGTTTTSSTGAGNSGSGATASSSYDNRNWSGIIEAASNMTKHQRSNSQDIEDID